MRMKFFALMLIASASVLTSCEDAKKMLDPDGGGTGNSGSSDYNEVASYTASLNGAAVVPPTGSSATGAAEFVLMQDGSIQWSLRTTGLSNVVASHVHAGEVGLNAPIVFTLF